MPKKKAPASEPSGPKSNNSKQIISIQHREIKTTGRKFDNGYMELRVWLPLWELPLWLTPVSESQKEEAIARIVSALLGGAGDE